MHIEHHANASVSRLVSYPNYSSPVLQCCNHGHEEIEVMK